MGMCDPKAVRAGEPWYKQVNKPGFMNLQPVQPAKGTAILCCQCGKWGSDSSTYYDKEGLPFKAYYCEACTIALKATQPNQ